MLCMVRFFVRTDERELEILCDSLVSSHIVFSEQQRTRHESDWQLSFTDMALLVEQATLAPVIFGMAC